MGESKRKNKRAKPKKDVVVSAPHADPEWDALQDRFETMGGHDWASLAKLVK